MSKEERQSLIGKTFEEYAEAKLELLALRVKAQNIGNPLRKVAEYLCRRDHFQVKPGELATELKALDGCDIRDLVEQIEVASAARDSLYRTLRELGAEPKE